MRTGGRAESELHQGVEARDAAQQLGRLQPYAMEPATVCHGACNRTARSLQP